MDKRGLSPLIATVLLIAFAVAIGAVLMAYSGTLGECGTVDILIPTETGSPAVCFDQTQNGIQFTIENGQKEDVQSFKVTLHGVNDIVNLELDEMLGTSEAKRFTIPYDLETLGALEKMKISPIIIEDGEHLVCPADKSLIIENIPNCS
jgi:flagellin-like protein